MCLPKYSLFIDPYFFVCPPFRPNIAVMRPLDQLPVWVVIRLCTNEDNMVNYWNNIDSAIELNMDVIDDPLGEAKEIHR